MLLHFDHSHLSMPKSRLVSKKSISPPSAHKKNGIFVLKRKITTMKRLTLLFSALLLSLVAVAQPSVTSLRVDRMSAPVGIDSRQPLLSWIIESPTRSTTQSAYEISVYEGQLRISVESGNADIRSFRRGLYSRQILVRPAPEFHKVKTILFGGLKALQKR